VQSHIAHSFAARPWGWALPFTAGLGLIGVRLLIRRNRDLQAFLFSCVYVAGMLASAAFGLYPYLQLSNATSGVGLTVYESAAAPHGLAVAVAWLVPGTILVAAYFTFVYRTFAGKVDVESGDGRP
jgi:cytochrome d ubiquinol oxidase subunit II